MYDSVNQSTINCCNFINSIYIGGQSNLEVLKIFKYKVMLINNTIYTNLSNNKFSF
jgi:hypothetical protein